MEPKHQHILNVARALRFQGCLLIDFWWECVLTIGYLINITSSLVLNRKTLSRVLYSRDPTYDHLRVFGLLCYAHKQGRLGDKFDCQSRRCIFVGYPYGKKGWCLYGLETNEFFVSRDVKFLKIDFPFALLLKEDLPTTFGLGGPKVDFEEFDDLGEKGDKVRHEDHVVFGAIPLQHEVNVISPTNNTFVQEPNEQDDLEFHEELLGRGHRHKKPSVLLHDYVTHTIHKLSPFPLTPKCDIPHVVPILLHTMWIVIIFSTT